MTIYQPGILQEPPPMARYLSFRLLPEADPRAALGRLGGMVDGDRTVVGIGPVVVSRLGAKVPGLREPTALEGKGISIPATPSALWLWLRGADHGEILHRGRALSAALEAAFVLDSLTDGFRFREGRDLTGYEDGTENPEGAAAEAVAFVSDQGHDLDGSSFVAVQKWVHDLSRFAQFPQAEQDAVIGRRIRDNEELQDAPESAHVKRTAQERFTPEAFLLRRSMPWADATGEGLVFVAFGNSFSPFELQMRSMCGLEDGIADALFRFTRPITSGYFWCPPIQNQKLNLRMLGI